MTVVRARGSWGPFGGSRPRLRLVDSASSNPSATGILNAVERRGARRRLTSNWKASGSCRDHEQRRSSPSSFLAT